MELVRRLRTQRTKFHKEKKMRNLVLRRAVLAATAAATLGSAGSALAASASATATATIVQAITLTNTASLNFGSIAPNTTGGNVVVDSADTRSSCDAGFCSGTVTSAAFTVAGAPSYNYSITLPTTSASLTGAGTAMTVSSFAHSAGATPALSATGAASFKVGGTLAVGGGQTAGTYTGSFSVTVDYQ
jgi:Mat/Ecp fimbriae major subunit